MVHKPLGPHATKCVFALFSSSFLCLPIYYFLWLSIMYAHFSFVFFPPTRAQTHPCTNCSFGKRRRRRMHRQTLGYGRISLKSNWNYSPFLTDCVPWDIGTEGELCLFTLRHEGGDQIKLVSARGNCVSFQKNGLWRQIRTITVSLSTQLMSSMLPNPDTTLTHI